VSRQLSQQEIDAVFQTLGERSGVQSKHPQATPFDFGQLDRIPKSQLKAIRLLHDNFVRSLASTLSAYLRTYLTANLVSVEQLSYSEFLGSLASPTCLVCVALRPYDGQAVLELNPALTFQFLEIILGGKGKASAAPAREITEIEQSLLDGVVRVILGELKAAWASVAEIDFTMESLETEPQFLQVLDPGEAFVAVAMEMKIGETSGMMNLAYPSLIIKMMRTKFDHHGSLRKAQTNEEDQARLLRLVKPAELSVDVRLQGPSISVRDLLRLEESDIVPLDCPVDKPLDLFVNGQSRFSGQIVSVGNKKAFVIGERQTPSA